MKKPRISYLLCGAVCTLALLDTYPTFSQERPICEAEGYADGFDPFASTEEKEISFTFSIEGCGNSYGYFDYKLTILSEDDEDFSEELELSGTWVSDYDSENGNETVFYSKLKDHEFLDNVEVENVECICQTD